MKTPFDVRIELVERKAQLIRAQIDALRLARDRYIESYERRAGERAVEAELRQLR